MYKLTAVIPKGWAKGDDGERVDFYTDTEFTIVSETPFPEEEKKYHVRWGLGFLSCEGKDISVKRIVDIDNPTIYEDVGKIVIFNDAPIERYNKKSGDAYRGEVIGKYKSKFADEEQDVRKCYRHYGVVEDIKCGIYTIKTDNGKTVFAERPWITFTDTKCAKCLAESIGKKVLIRDELENSKGEDTFSVCGKIGTIIGIRALSYKFGKAAFLYVRVGEEIFSAFMQPSGGKIAFAKKGLKEGEGIAWPCFACENNSDGNCQKHEGYSFMTECEQYSRFREWRKNACAGEIEF